MLDALNRVPVTAGDTFFVPAGQLHVIGEGLLIVELQEPSDLSVLLEWEGFEIDGAAEGHLGLGLRHRPVGRRPRPAERRGARRAARGPGGRARGVERLFPPEADEFFRAERLRPQPSSELDRGYSIVVVLEGSGRLVTEAGDLDLTRGDSVLVPWAAGEGALEGELSALRCRPPESGGP